MTTSAISPSVTIRKALPSDEATILDICVRTADSGQDGSHLYTDPRLPGFVWALPYVRLCSENAFVLTKEGAVVGYCVAAAETNDYEDQLEAEWWPQLQTELCDFSATTAEDQNVLSYIRCAPRTPAPVTDRYPAHLHINLLPEVQQGGYGTALLLHQLGALKRSGVEGVHLGVNQHNGRVIGFYAKFGFVEFDRTPSILMGKRLIG